MNPGEKGQRARALFSYGTFHFIDDGFADSIYLLLPFIAVELHLSFSEVGILKGVFSGAMGLCQLPLSLLGEKVGELTVIASGTIGLAAGFLFLSLATTFPAFFITLILAKGVAAGQHGLSSSVLSRVFEGPGRRAAMGTFNFSGDMGKVCLPFLLALLINFIGWRPAVFSLSIGGILLTAMFWVLARKGQAGSNLLRPSRTGFRGTAAGGSAIGKVSPPFSPSGSSTSLPATPCSLFAPFFY